jgi:predicted enzyme related to lactoylglutathione lyase
MSGGEIRYLQIPAADVETAAGFYASVFGWAIRNRGTDEVAFDDASGHVSGTWIRDRPPFGQAGLLVYIQVESVEATLEIVTECGGEIASAMTTQGAGEAFATFRDPAGNVLGIFHEGGADAI